MKYLLVLSIVLLVTGVEASTKRCKNFSGRYAYNNISTFYVFIQQSGCDLTLRKYFLSTGIWSAPEKYVGDNVWHTVQSTLQDEIRHLSFWNRDKDNFYGVSRAVSKNPVAVIGDDKVTKLTPMPLGRISIEVREGVVGLSTGVLSPL